MKQPLARKTRSFIILAVLVVVGSAVLVCTGLLFLTQAHVSAAVVSAETVQMRSLAWSGVQAVMSRLADQRDLMLEGREPALDEQMVIYEGGGRIGLVRLRVQDAQDSLLAPEASRVDLNSADADALARTGLVDAREAATIISMRDGRPGKVLDSVAAVLAVPGITRDRLVTGGHPLGDDAPGVAAPATGGTDGDGQSPPLDQVFTTFAVEPAVNVQGEARIDVNGSWDDQTSRRVEAFDDQEVAVVLALAHEAAKRFESDAQIVQALRTAGTKPDQWGHALDTFSSHAGEFHFGRLDINTASLAALMSLPVLTAEQAQRIVRLRDELPMDERSLITWPLTTGIVDEAQFEAIVDRITTRSWVYRVVVEAGEIRGNDPDAEMTPSVVLEAVIDCAGARPRAAYLRDITYLQAAERLVAMEASDEPEQSIENEPDPEVESPPESPMDAAPGDDLPPIVDEAPVDEPIEEDADESAQPAADEPEPVVPSGRRRNGRWTSPG